MALHINLTDDGDPVCAGTLTLDGGAGGTADALRLGTDEAGYEKLCLFQTRHGFGLRVFAGATRQPGGFYDGTAMAGSVFIRLPKALSTFLESRLREPITAGPQSLSLSGNDQLTPDCPAAGGAGTMRQSGRSRYIDDAPITHVITDAQMDLQPVAEGVGVRLTLRLASRPSSKSRKQKTPTTATALFLIDHGTRHLRFRGRIDRQPRQPGLRRAYAGDEVQTDRYAMNLTHPLVYNMGGIFALCPAGTHQLMFSAKGTRIKPVTLSGWGWGTVYAAEEIASLETLHLPWLSQRFICEALTMLGQRDGRERLVATINRNEKTLGTLTPSTPRGGNKSAPQTLTRVNTQFMLDKLGLTIALHAAPAGTDHSPYERTLLLPWEVLILRDFDLDPRLIE
ncbi:MAG: hypothetical protein AAGH42_05680 [Pseudomonadota bacterium]